MKHLLFQLSILFLVFPFVFAESSHSSFQFIDAETGETLRDVLVTLTFSSDAFSREHVLYMRGETLPLTLPFGSYLITAFLDHPSTESPDYYFHGYAEVSDTALPLTVFPIAQINGNVYDASHTLVRGALLDIQCEKLMTLSFPEKTDKYGSFLAYVPTGRCVIAATDNDFVGKAKIVSERGISSPVDLILDTPRTQDSRFLLIGGLIILALIILFFLVKYIHLPRKKKIHRENPQLGGVLKTLNDMERQIVAYVAEQKHTTSSAIRHQLKIPRTSLARILERLAAKKIIELERYGKMKKVKMASWLIKR